MESGATQVILLGCEAACGVLCCCVAGGRREGYTTKATNVANCGPWPGSGGGRLAEVCGMNWVPTFLKYTEITPARGDLVIIDDHARSSKLQQVNGTNR